MSEEKIIRKLEHLLAKKEHEELSDSELRELSSLLEKSEAARICYLDHCEIQALLEMDSDFQHLLAGNRIPKNVVAISDAPHAGNLRNDPVIGKPASCRSKHWMKAAAAIVILGLVSLLIKTSVKKTVEPVVTQTDQPVKPVVAPIPEVMTPIQEDKEVLVLDNGEEVETNPMDKYEEMLLTAVEPGSLKRPPAQLAGGMAPSDKISFNRDIRPLLADKCYNCHGPNEESREAELRLDVEEAIFVDRGKDKPVLIERGDPAKSDLYRRMIARDPDDLMPPGDSHKVLTKQEIGKFKQWIVEGAEWESHWAFIPPKAKDLPKAKSDWGANEIDSFILASLEGKNMKPSPEADRRTLIRRLSFDTTGLPPTAEEVGAFVNDRSSDAYEKLLDRLLDSPRYGEHRARYWLDAARYGDTHGLHLDNYRSIWPYRDWVINAFNRNLPFDQFTIEQLAGDLLQSPTQDQLVATGFNRCNVTSSEGGAIAEEFLSRYAIDRVSTLGSVWLGLTLGCVQCHDHKFDPLSQKEFYELIAFFNNTEQPGMDGNSVESPPSIRVYSSLKAKKESETLQQQIAAEDKKLNELRKTDKAAFDAWVKTPEQVLKAGKDFKIQGALLKEAITWKTEDEPKDMGSIAAFKKSTPFSIHLSFKAPATPGRAVVISRVDPKNNLRGYRLVWEDEGLTLELIERWPNRTLRRGTSRRFKKGSTADVLITYDGSGTSEGIRFYQNGKFPGSRFMRNWMDTMEGDFDSLASLKIGGCAGDGYLPTAGEDFRIFGRKLTDAEALLMYTQRRLSSITKKKVPSADENSALANLYALSKNEAFRKVFLNRADLETKRSQLVSQAPETLVWKEKADAPVAWVLDRGEYDKKKEKVFPGVPAILHPMAKDAPKNRLGLAKWLTDSGNPLTARVVVNRFWVEIFGSGLVKTVGDFGAQGTTASHPELLDWMALNFMESGWDMKATYRKILMSATYRQSSRITPELTADDPENRLLARGPRFRLDAEMIRDQALAAGGVLINKIGGPGVKPYQPTGLWKAVGYTGSNTQTFSQDYGKAEYRRSIYTLIKRTAPPPNMSLFNAPNRENCVVARERTNTPLQALALMNDEQYINAARHLAVRTVNHGKNVDERIAYLSNTLLARHLSGNDLAVMKNSYHAFEKSYQQDKAAAKELNASPGNGKVTSVEMASWIMLSNQMLNLDEVINKN